MIKSCYIHIPFCEKICSYCDFCKEFYDKKKVREYLQKLKQEVKEIYQGEPLETIYIGGGTPTCLEIEEIKQAYTPLETVQTINQTIAAINSKVNMPVNTLSSSGTISLSDNSVNKITASGAITFSLPSVSDNTKFHQILVQLYMSSVYSINLGTSNYFNASAPDMSTAGYYTIIWEYDSIRGGWSVGAARKA